MNNIAVFASWRNGLLFAEGDGVDDADGDAAVGVAPGTPAWHLGEQTHGFEVEGSVAAFDHFEMGDVAVGIYYEAACDAPFDALLVGFGRIAAVFVDVGHEGFVASGEGWFLVDEIVFEDFLDGLEAVG